MIWAQCNGATYIGPIHGTLHRLVESQEQIATRNYVDTLEEQGILEDLLEKTKPPYPQGSQALHYLLRTPFRYPPLPWGSRFGQRHEPSLFYGATRVETTLAEAAYYRFVFWHSIDAPPPNPKLQSQHTMFGASYKTQQGVRLQHPPFKQHAGALTHPTRYEESQQLGADMRLAGVEVFEYMSARDPEGGTCIALFTPQAFGNTQPLYKEAWFCEVTATHTAFKRLDEPGLYTYPLAHFLVDGHFPLPAA